MSKPRYPYIDVCMRQLRTQGYLHHLARHSVASFVTRGDLWLPWEIGSRVFDELLFDADYSINMGNWMWLSASYFFYEYFRVYSPIAFPKKTDEEGTVVKHFAPELKEMPGKYIYEPWKAPLSVQQKTNCSIGKEYPNRVVDHDKVSKANKEKMKQTYVNKTYGKPPQTKLDTFIHYRTVIQQTSTIPFTSAANSMSTTVRPRKRKLDQMQNE